MSYYYKTLVPNSLFDLHLKNLSLAELKVILVIIRQTYGWLDKRTRKPKQWDWISRQFFVKKTNLSLRAVSEAIAKLHRKNLIDIKNEKGILIYTSSERRRAYKLYYRANLERPVQKFT